MQPDAPMFRIALFAIACAAVAWGSLAPSEALPTVTIWDKVQHAGAYFVLALLGAWTFPRRLPVALGLIAFGAGIEVAQATMDLGRQGDVLDGLANTFGVVVGMVLWPRR